MRQTGRESTQGTHGRTVMLNFASQDPGRQSSGYGARRLITACALSALLAAAGCCSVSPSCGERAAPSDASTFRIVAPLERARSVAPPTRTFRLPDRGELEYATSSDYLADSSTRVTWPEAAQASSPVLRVVFPKRGSHWEVGRLRVDLVFEDSARRASSPSER